MKIGIYFTGGSQESGGYYTYEQEILHSFISLEHSSKHSFVFFSPNGFIDRQIDDVGEKFQCVRIPKKDIIAKIFTHLYLSFDFPFIEKLYYRHFLLHDEIKKHRIDFMIFLSPFHAIVGIPSITPVWDLQHRLQPWFPEVSENGEWERREKYYRKVLRKSSIILAGTSTGREEISHLYNIPKSRIRVLPLPTPSDVLVHPHDQNQTRFKKFQTFGEYLLYPAQFWPHKNHIVCIQALKILHQKYQKPFSLVFVGSDQKNLHYIRKQIESLDMSDGVHILGFVSRDELIELYQNAFAMLFPSFFGPDNIPPLEAFALKCPVIAANVPGATEQLGDAALLFDPKNPDELAEVVNFLYSNPKARIDLIEKGYSRSNQWTSDDYVREIFSLVNEFEKIRRCWE
jgi:glycosyltransferase involved in cell wall biosynthesis